MAEHWWIDAFELQCWRRLLSVPWTTKRSNWSILKEISPKYSLERLMLKLKRQSFGQQMWRADSLEKTLMLRKTEAGKGNCSGWDGWMALLTQPTWVWANSRRWWRTGRPGCCRPWGQSRTQLSNWTTQWSQARWEKDPDPSWLSCLALLNWF